MVCQTAHRYMEISFKGIGWAALWKMKMVAFFVLVGKNNLHGKIMRFENIKNKFFGELTVNAFLPYYSIVMLW